jgi:high-affinity iron transporter
MTKKYTLSLLLVSALLLLAPLAARANDTVQTVAHMLGYIAVDYPDTVRNGKIINDPEYAEQREFAERLTTLLAQLPANADKAALASQANTLVRLIADKAAGNKVAALTYAMREQLIKSYQVTVAPRRAPDLAQGAQLYAENCAGCHGAEGKGDGTLAASLDPKPVNFHEQERQTQRSVYALYNAISLGVEGTAMLGYGSLKEDQRWALAFYVSNFLANDTQRELGAAAWTRGTYSKSFTDLASLTQTSPAEIVQEYGQEGANVLAYLRSEPQALSGKQETPLAFSARKLSESLVIYREGRHEQAYQTAVTAYLEGFELAEAGLTSVNPAMKAAIESEMFAYRAMLKEGRAPADAAAQVEKINAMLAEARALMETTNLTPSVAFASALVILLREGLEAILLLAAMVAFLVKTGRRDALPYIHAGWMSALVAGFGTWLAATFVIDISGASRELTEGITALFAAGILFYVGVWLHNKLQAQRWKQFIESKVKQATGGQTLWALTTLSFIAVYREMFETVLFYQTLWVQAGEAGHHMVFSGFLVGSVSLVVLSWLIFRFSVRLPLKLFFGINSALMYLLAVVFAGKGVAALQAAGRIPMNGIDFPRIDVLGIYPNMQSLGLQLALVTLAVVFLVLNQRQARRVRAEA